MPTEARGYHALLYEAIDDSLIEQPKYASVCYQFIRSLRDKEFEPGMVSALFQEWDRHRLQVYDGYLFSLLWTALCAGDIHWTTLEIGLGPERNNDKEQNNRRLSQLAKRKWIRVDNGGHVDRTLQRFAGIFSGPLGIGDGYIEWHTPLTVGSVSPWCGEAEQSVPPTRAPLEVGYTRLTTTYYHLRTSGCLARWPYDCTQLYIFWANEGWRS
jgi:hypothetical protein